MEREFLLDANAFYNLLRAMNPESKECGTLRSHRGLAQPPLAGRALSIRLRGRHLPAPQLGRRVRKCCCFGGDRRE